MATATATAPPVDTGARGADRPARTSLTVSAWTLVSKITGVLRIVVVAAVLGPTFFANVFVSTNTVPSLIYSATAGPVLGLVLVPAVVRALAVGGRAEGEALLGRVTGAVLSAAALVAGLVLLAAPGIALLLTFGIADPAERGRAWGLAVLMLVFVAPQVVLYAVGAIGAAAQQARGRFALAAAAPAAENLGLMVTVGAAGMLYGGGLATGDVPLGMVLLLGLGATASVVLHAGLQVVGAARAGLRLRPSRTPDPAAAEVHARMRSSLGVAAGPALSMFAVLALGATVPGGVLVLQIAYAVYALPLALGVRAIMAAVLPGMARSSAGGDRVGYAARWRQALGYTLTASVPALCLMVGFGGPAAEVLAGGELAGGPLVGALGTCLVIFGITQLALAVTEIGRQALFARLEYRWPRRVSGIALAVTLAVGPATLLLPAVERLVALAAVVLVAELTGAVVQVAAVRRAVRPLRALDGRSLAAVAVGVGAMFPVIVVGRLLHAAADGWSAVAVAAGAGLVALGCYAVAVLVLMPAPTDRPAGGGTDPAPALLGAGLVVAVAVAAAGTVAGPVMVVGGLLAAVLFGLCAWRPIVGVYVYGATVLFLAGMARGSLVPLVRPNEALLGLLLAGAATGGYVRWVRAGCRPPRIRPLDAPLAALVLAATLWPVASLMLRGRVPTLDEVLAVAPVLKLVAFLVLVRLTVRTEAQLVRIIRTILWTTAAVAVIAVLQTLGVGPVLDLLSTFWAAADGSGAEVARGSTTLASSIATGDVVLIGIALLVGCAVRGMFGLRERIALGLLLGTGVLAAGQFSTWIAAAVVGGLALWRFPALRGVAVRFLPLGAVAAVVGAPAFLGRIESIDEFGVPRSWLGRWDNLSNFYLPRLGEDFAFLVGVSPDSVLHAPETWRSLIFLESGYLQLLWVGGVPLLAAFLWLSVALLDRVRPRCEDPGPLGACATALWLTWWMVVLLSVIDPHVFLRGTGDLLFLLIGLVTGALAADTWDRARTASGGVPR